MAMNITIEEIDIKKSIEDHVRSLIPGLREDTVVEITLSATRGAAGFTAGIRLISAEEVATSQVAPAEPAKKEPEAVPEKPLGIAEKVGGRGGRPRKAVAERTDEESKEETSEAIPETDNEKSQPVEEEPVVEEPADTQQVEETAPVDENEAAAKEPTADTPRVSLFSNLKRPQNSPA